MRNLAVLDLFGPVIESGAAHFPEFAAEVEVLQDGILLPRFEERFCERHVGAERIQLRRARGLTGFQQVIIRFFYVSILQRDAAKDKVRLVNGIAFIPIFGSFLASLSVIRWHNQKLPYHFTGVESCLRQLI